MMEEGLRRETAERRAIARMLSEGPRPDEIVTVPAPVARKRGPYKKKGAQNV